MGVVANTGLPGHIASQVAGPLARGGSQAFCRARTDQSPLGAGTAHWHQHCSRSGNLGNDEPPLAASRLGLNRLVWRRHVSDTAHRTEFSRPLTCQSLQTSFARRNYDLSQSVRCGLRDLLSNPPFPLAWVATYVKTRDHYKRVDFHPKEEGIRKLA